MECPVGCVVVAAACGERETELAGVGFPRYPVGASGVGGCCLGSGVRAWCGGRAGMSEDILLLFVSTPNQGPSRVELKRGDEVVASRSLCPADEDWQRAEQALREVYEPLILSPLPTGTYRHSYRHLRAVVGGLFPE